MAGKPYHVLEILAVSRQLVARIKAVFLQSKVDVRTAVAVSLRKKCCLVVDAVQRRVRRDVCLAQRRCRTCMTCDSTPNVFIQWGCCDSYVCVRNVFRCSMFGVCQMPAFSSLPSPSADAGKLAPLDIGQHSPRAKSNHSSSLRSSSPAGNNAGSRPKEQRDSSPGVRL